MDLSSIKTKTGSISITKLNSPANKHIKEKIWSLTSFLPEDRPVSQRIYCIENGITETPRCPITGVDLKWNPNKKRFSVSRIAALKDRNINFDTIKEKYKNIYQTLDKKYQTYSFKLLSKDDILTCFNYTLNIKAWDIAKNYDLFCSILHHTSFLPDDSKWGERMYCIKNNITSRLKSADGGYKKYINSKVGYSKYSSRQNMHELKLEEVVEYFNIKGFDIVDNINHLSNQYKLKIKCQTCGARKSQIMVCQHWKNVICNKCTGAGRSFKEDEIASFVQTLVTTEILFNYKIPNSRYEIDIFIPEFNVGIEYHGVLWHSFGINYPRNADTERTNKTKHINKYLACRENNIKLLQIFCSEWEQKNDIIKSMIRSKLGQINERIYARECVVREIDKDIKAKFLNENHIQGNCQSFKNIGLFYKNNIVAVMTFSNRLQKNKNIIELSRFAVKQNYTVVGGFSKLLKNFNTDKHIISYCDLRFSSGNVYDKAGFKLARRSPPNYFYTQDCKLLESRHKYQKQKLKKYDNYSDDKTETQIMYENGFRKIYDAGNLVYYYN